MNSFFSEDNWINWVDAISDNHYVVIDNILPHAVLNDLKDCFDKQREEEQLRKAAIGTLNQKHIDPSIRGDKILWLDREGAPAPILTFFDLAEDIRQNLNRYCYLSLSGYEFHFAHYPVGTFYKRHLDQFQGRNNRMISIILYLNEEWKPEYGGELKIYLEKEDVTIMPTFGRMVLFKSDVLEHEVLETKHDRYSLTGWMLYKPVGLGYLP
ncbi:2OG-Fe(II) oxygenase [Reichenbachiella agarivorans]|uniref:2OG-Fe(II) oxygenase n=1 Tax=Reichenbachiella agarivorans TaxID=2979464 RepID=A0ABY6CTH9_9BACT|nr:2OG-Fe(II) oxygenase [Reichenbachiella agarivorans]UXP31545.1 2OG-Fe(II) oxygenase [Reichenbachiella agarivorans]